MKKIPSFRIVNLSPCAAYVVNVMSVK